MLWFALPVRVYLKPAVSKNFYGFCCGSAPCGWLTGGLVDVKGLEGENGVKKVAKYLEIKKYLIKKNFSSVSTFSGACNGNHTIFLGLTGLCRGRMQAEAFMQLQQLLETPVGYILKK
jgi:hypothetical protein